MLKTNNHLLKESLSQMALSQNLSGFITNHSLNISNFHGINQPETSFAPSKNQSFLTNNHSKSILANNPFKEESSNINITTTKKYNKFQPVNNKDDNISDLPTNFSEGTNYNTLMQLKYGHIQN